ncbi:MAG: hypothetical protein K8T10_16845 [Candidatus Eremiobacteraeota bacterium]|nr:hypothetical protein [Candidatus Eremiobacteraeota bacterium]
MGWLKSLLGKFGGKSDEVKIVSEKKEISKKSIITKPVIGEEIAPVPIEEPLKEIFGKLIESKVSYIFFDPEETKCYVYLLSDNNANEIDKFPVDEWKKKATLLKEINSKLIELDGNKYICVLNVSLTNLGERIAVALLEPGTPDDEIKEKKRNAIRLVNKLKPATSLTHINIENLEKTIESVKEKADGDIFKLFMESELLKRKEADELKAENGYRSILSLPLPRKQVVLNVAKWLGIEYYDIEISDYDEKTARILPEEMARRLNAIVFEEEEKNVKIVMTNPFNKEHLNEIENKLGKKVIPFMSCEEDIRYEMGKIYREY